ncbi:anthranilate phosphoribosyltransferase [Patescibacteria group bacterium]|nr:anthranilate phosphoribosyltransferase [Patescibacteria group bacterium]
MKKYLNKIIGGHDLTADEAAEVTRLIMTGKVTDAEISDFLVALSEKGEAIEEIVGMVKVMREQMNQVEVAGRPCLPMPTGRQAAGRLLDTCGTGGDGVGTINVSTAAAIVCAAAGAKVAKHGNRAASSQSGSADVLEALGVKVDLGTQQVKKCIEEVGIGFMFAPNFHPAMKYVMPARKALGIRTIFNFLGPLSNPAGAQYQVIGVSQADMAAKLGQALMELGSEKVIIVNSDDGLDEVSVSAPTQVYEFAKGQEVKKYKIEPAKFYNIDEVKGGTAEENAQDIKDIFAGKLTGAKKDIVVANAAMGLLAYEMADSYQKCRVKAEEVIEDGQAAAKLAQWVEVSNKL